MRFCSCSLAPIKVFIMLCGNLYIYLSSRLWSLKTSKDKEIRAETRQQRQQTLKIMINNNKNTFIMSHSGSLSTVQFQLSFKCSGSPRPPPSTVDPHVDPHTGVQLQEVTATISKDLVFEYFGKSPFKCECHAWSPRGTAKSRSATVEVACKLRFFFQYNC